ncbi:MAG TPA: hypothetical protein DCQ33_16095 [Nitrospira sp.]|nr:hypothetical protein [Nitrospira sp.]
METKLCVVCGEALPLLRRSDRRYCGVGCRVRAHKIRGSCAPGQRRPRQEGSHSAAAILGIVATAATVEALCRELEQEREQRHAELEQERQIVVELSRLLDIQKRYNLDPSDLAGLDAAVQR